MCLSVCVQQMVTLALMPDLQHLLFPPAPPPAPHAAPATSAPARESTESSSAEHALKLGDLFLTDAALSATCGVVSNAPSTSNVWSWSLTNRDSAPGGAAASGSIKEAPTLAPQLLTEPSSSHDPSSVPPSAPQFKALLGGQSRVSKALKKLLLEPQLYLKHYSKDLIFSQAAAEQMVLPDKKPLPNTL